MIGLTTHPGGGKGYQMYLDGALVADMASDGSYLSASPYLLSHVCCPFHLIDGKHNDLHTLCCRVPAPKITEHWFALAFIQQPCTSSLAPAPHAHVADVTGNDGQLVAVTGGGPMAITGPMFLCARSDLSPGRFYSGRLANLAVYNTSLSAAAMAGLYDQAKSPCRKLLSRQNPGHR